MEKNKDKIKIFISYHKESQRIESEILTPIQVGAKKSKIDLQMQRDDEGIHISDKNDKYCELTAQYWAWKNLDADYYGFMHYRRHLIFKDVPYEFDDGRPVFRKKINRTYREDIGLEDNRIRRYMENADLVLPLPVDTSSWGAVCNEVQFSCLDNLHAADFDMVCKTVTELYPDYSDAVQEFRTDHYSYWYNMFVMKKEIFNHYCQWLFSILEVSETKIDFTNYNPQETRTLAFMAERLLSIYLIKLRRDRPDLKIKHLKMTLVYNTDPVLYEEGEDENPDEYEESLKKYSEPEYIFCVERAYGELRDLQLPYDLKDLFKKEKNSWEISLQEKEILFYGGGNWCKQLLIYFEQFGIKKPIEIWDKEAEMNQTIRGIPIVKPDFRPYFGRNDLVWIITIRNKETSSEVKTFLRDNGANEILENRELVNWLSYQLWLHIKVENGIYQKESV